MGKTERANPLRLVTDDPVDRRGVRYAVPSTETYLTVTEIAKTLNLHSETVWRWCRKWFGALPPGRAGRGMGYRIPPVYLKVAKVWGMTEDERIRNLAREVLVREGEGKNFLVVVGKEGSAVYSGEQVVERLKSVTADTPPDMIAVIYLGDS